MGDEIQALKAGIMEIADIFVVNKADREDADRAAQEIHQMIMMSEPFRGWRPRVLKTVATSGDGVAGLVETINQHAKYLGDSGGLRKTRVARLPSEVLEVAKQYFEEVTLKEIATSEMFQKIMRQVTANKIDPYSAGRKLVSKRLARR
jgi:LAO/AO transport system kinase